MQELGASHTCESKVHMLLPWFVLGTIVVVSVKGQQQGNGTSVVGGVMRIVGANGVVPTVHFAGAGVETKCEWSPNAFAIGDTKGGGLTWEQKYLALLLHTEILNFNTDSLSVTAKSPVSIKGTLNIGSFSIGGNKDWFFWAVDTFDSGGQPWTVADTSTCGASSDIFLGGHCKFGGRTTTERKFENLPSHSAIQITARVHFFDKWLGEAVVMKLDGTTSWSRQYKWCTEVLTAQCSKHGVDTCGTNFPDK